jgi:hypothetical protein
MSTSLDSRGVLRGRCIAQYCGCQGYERSVKGDCLRCSHFPTVHNMLNTAPSPSYTVPVLGTSITHFEPIPPNDIISSEMPQDPQYQGYAVQPSYLLQQQQQQPYSMSPNVIQQQGQPYYSMQQMSQNQGYLQPMMHPYYPTMQPQQFARQQSMIFTPDSSLPGQNPSCLLPGCKLPASNGFDCCSKEHSIIYENLPKCALPSCIRKQYPGFPYCCKKHARDGEGAPPMLQQTITTPQPTSIPAPQVAAPLNPNQCYFPNCINNVYISKDNIISKFCSKTHRDAYYKLNNLGDSKIIPPTPVAPVVPVVPEKCINASCRGFEILTVKYCSTCNTKNEYNHKQSTGKIAGFYLQTSDQKYTELEDHFKKKWLKK